MRNITKRHTGRSIARLTLGTSTPALIFSIIATAAHAGPCTAQIADVDRKVALVASTPTHGPYAPQSVSAQLHHQPTPATVQGAQSTANADAAAALEKARQADKNGDAAACSKALTEAKRLYGL
jgi:hypothetical protein